MRKAKRIKMDLVTLLVSLVGGTAWAILGIWLQNKYMGNMWSAWVIALYFGGMALLMIPAFYAGYAINGYSAPKGKDKRNAWLLILAVLISAGVLETIYEMTVSKDEKATSYVFVVDCSSSISDSQKSRQTSIQKLCSEMPKDMPCAVFGFDREYKELAPFTGAGQLTHTDLGFYKGSSTNFAAGVNAAMDIIDANSKLAGDKPRIVLMSDGENNVDKALLTPALNRAIARNVEICTVAVDVENPSQLRAIAQQTGGIFAETNEISQLYTAMKVAAADKYVTRTLIAPRPVMPMDWLYSLMRISFLLILGFLIFCIKTCLMRTNLAGNNVPLGKIFAANYLPVVVSTLLMEFFVDQNTYLFQMILSLCFTAAVSFKAVGGMEDEDESGQPLYGDGTWGSISGSSSQNSGANWGSGSGWGNDSGNDSSDTPFGF